MADFPSKIFSNKILTLRSPGPNNIFCIFASSFLDENLRLVFIKKEDLNHEKVNIDPIFYYEHRKPRKNLKTF